MILENWIVELFGVSAVGKTTLLRAFLEETDAPWMRRTDLEKQNAGRPHALHEELLLKKGRWILAQTEMPISKRAERVARLSRILNTDIAARNALPKASFLDEGIAHHLGGFLQSFSAERIAPVSSFMKAYAFVHLKGDAERILSRAHMRLKDNPQCGTYSAFENDEAILRYIETSIQTHKKLAEFTAEVGCPTLSLDIEETAAQHIDALQAFVEELRSNTRSLTPVLQG